MNLSERTPIWIALSDFYLDNELQDFEFEHILSIIKESPYSLEEVKEIDKEEVFPVLYPNLLSVAGVWSGFSKEWLVTEITERFQKKSWFKDFIIKVKYARLKWMFDDYWKKLEEVYQKH